MRSFELIQYVAIVGLAALLSETLVVDGHLSTTNRKVLQGTRLVARWGEVENHAQNQIRGLKKKSKNATSTDEDDAGDDVDSVAAVADDDADDGDKPKKPKKPKKGDDADDADDADDSDSQGATTADAGTETGSMAPSESMYPTSSSYPSPAPSDPVVDGIGIQASGEDETDTTADRSINLATGTEQDSSGATMMAIGSGMLVALLLSFKLF